MQNYKLVHRIAAAFSFAVSFLVYLRTIAPTTSFWDCGEFITCSYTLGVPHPPGAPFYLLLGRIFSMLPIATDIGLRVNVISALSSALSVMLTYLIIVRLIKQWRGRPGSGWDVFTLTTSGLIGALTYAFTDTFWFNAVEAEVYAISMVFTSIIVWLILVWLERSEQSGAEKYLLMIAYLLGLAIGVHLLMILALPAVATIIYYRYLEQSQKKIDIGNIVVFGILTVLGFLVIYPGVVQIIPQMAGKFSLWSVVVLLAAIFFGIYWAISSRYKIISLILMALLLVLVAYSTYSMIMLRSRLNPAIDENDPENMQQMVKYLNREQYGTWGTFPRRYPGLPPEWQFQQQYPNRNYATYNLGKQIDFMWNYQIIKMYLRYFAWQYIGKGTTLGQDGFITENFSTRGLWALPFLIGLFGMFHHFRRHWRHASTILAFFIMTGVAIVIYLNQEDPQPRERDYVFVGSFFAFALWIGMGVSAALEWVEETFKNNAKVKRLLGISVAALMTVILPINLFAHNFNSHNRTGNYVAYDYSYNILQSCEPNSILFTNGDNDTFPLWFLQYVYGIRTDVRVVNLSLLNTNWYIKQLKHEEPKVPISLRDDEIDALEIIRWEKRRLTIPVPPRIRDDRLRELGLDQQVLMDDEDTPKSITIEVEPTLFDQALRVQDYMILNILYANKWQKPMNFAVTVSDDNKVNLQDYLRMDGLSFKLVPYKGEQISEEKLRKNLFETFKYRGLDNPYVSFNDNIRGLLQNYRAAFMRLAREYLIGKENDKMVQVLDHMEKVIPEKNIPFPDYRLSLQIGQMYDMAGRSEELIKRAEDILEERPDNNIAYGLLVSTLSREGQHEKVIELLKSWLAIHPEDRQAQIRLEEERAKLAQDTTANRQ